MGPCAKLKSHSWAGLPGRGSGAPAAGPAAPREYSTLALMNAAERKERRRRRASFSLGQPAPDGQPSLLPELRAFYKADQGAAIELFTDQALLRREALRFSPRVATWSLLFWRSIDLDNSNTLEENEFMPYAMLLYKVLHGSWDEATARAACAEDWHSDRRGKNYINCETFLLSLFQLADTWTENIDEAEMVEFLETLFACVMRWDEARGGFSLRPLEDVRPGECMAEIERARLRRQRSSRGENKRSPSLQLSFRLQRQSSTGLLRSDSCTSAAAMAAAAAAAAALGPLAAATGADRELLEGASPAPAAARSSSFRRGGRGRRGVSFREGTGAGADGGGDRGEGGYSAQSDGEGRSPPPAAFNDGAGGWSLFHSLLQARNPQRAGTGLGKPDPQGASNAVFIPAISDDLYSRLLGQRWRSLHAAPPRSLSLSLGVGIRAGLRRYSADSAAPVSSSAAAPVSSIASSSSSLSVVPRSLSIRRASTGQFDVSSGSIRSACSAASSLVTALALLEAEKAAERAAAAAAALAAPAAGSAGPGPGPGPALDATSPIAGPTTSGAGAGARPQLQPLAPSASTVLVEVRLRSHHWARNAHVDSDALA
eukprot:tig00021070_g17839.t1